MGQTGPGEKQQPIRVMKFGGTSVGSAERMLTVVELVRPALAGQRVVVVASAVAGVTDLLEGAIARALDGEVASSVRRFAEIHRGLADDLADRLGRERWARLVAALDEQRAELERLLSGIALLRDASPRVRARTVTLGERASCLALAAAFEASGLPCVTLDPCRVLPCTGNPLEATPLPDAIRQRLQPHRESAIPLALLPGFLGGDETGDVLCLGRGGSDYSAALAAAALDAERLEIWTDVDGIFTADPRAVPAAHVLAEMSFEEAMELAYFGAKVLHPKTITPVRRAGIPVRIANALRPEAPGTWVGRRSASGNGAVRGLSYLRDVALVDLSGPGMAGVPGIAARAFGALARHRISLILITQGSSECTLCFCVRAGDAEPAVAALGTEFQSELESGRMDAIAVRQELVVLSAVGDGMRHRVGVAGAFFDALAGAGANVVAIAQGSSERSISAVLEEPAGHTALRSTHRRFFEGATASVVVLGVGTVGSELLRRLAVREERGVAPALRLLAVAASRRLLHDPAGLPPGEATARLRTAGRAWTLRDLLRQLEGERAIVVDCTASAELAAGYPEILAAGCDIVAANKCVGAGPRSLHRAVDEAARKNARRFAREATVGAGLPVFSTVRRLRDGGERVERCAGILSGSVSFLLGRLEDGVSFGAALREARERGLTEPDPTRDLLGLDAAGKILALARELGLDLEPEDVAREPALPEGCEGIASLAELEARAAEIDDAFAARIDAARRGGRVLRYVAEIADGRCRVALAEVGSDHAFHPIRGAESALAFWTESYSPQPLLLRGYGAGAGVTASALLADILSLTEVAR